MASAAFILGKWPKIHEHLVEELVAARHVLYVADVLPDLTQHWQHPLLRTWNPPSHPHLTLVPHMAGPFRRWSFLCQRCRRRCETLYTVLGAVREEWRCRRCLGLIHASQRHGFRHPLRRVLTRRKKVSRRKDVVRAERRTARRNVRLPVASLATEPEWWMSAEFQKQLDEWAVTECRKRSEAYNARLAKGNPMSKPVETIRISYPSVGAAAPERTVRMTVVEHPMDPRGQNPTEEAATIIEAVAPRALAFLRELAERAGSKRVREGAKRDMVRYERRLGSSQLTNQLNRP